MIGQWEERATVAKLVVSLATSMDIHTHSQTPSINTMNIDTLLVAADQQQTEIVLPPDELQDKIHFLFNNLSSSNLGDKVGVTLQTPHTLTLTCYSIHTPVTHFTHCSHSCVYTSPVTPSHPHTLTLTCYSIHASVTHFTHCSHSCVCLYLSPHTLTPSHPHTRLRSSVVLWRRSTSTGWLGTWS